MRKNILKQHNTIVGAKKVLFAPINTGEIETYDALIKCGFEVYSMNYEGSFNLEKYKQIKNKIEQEFIYACSNIKPDWVYLRIHKDILNPKYISLAKQANPNTIFSNWTGDVRAVPKPPFVEIGKVVDTSLIVSRGQIDQYKKCGLKDVRFVQAGTLINRFFRKSDKERKELNNKLSHDIVFCANNCGNFPGHKLRNEVVNKLIQKYGKKFALYGRGWPSGDYNRGVSPYDEQNNIYNGSKIAISINNFNNVEMYFSRRQLNAMACGTLTVSCYIPGLEEYFENGKDLVWFNTPDECMDLVDYYLKNQDLAEKIALNGAKKVREEHSQYNFAENMATTLGLL